MGNKTIIAENQNHHGEADNLHCTDLDHCVINIFKSQTKNRNYRIDCCARLAVKTVLTLVI